MCKLFDDWTPQIKGYCDENGLDFEKAKQLSQSWGRDILVLQYHDPKKGKRGLLDETPMPLVLLIRRDKNGKLTFEKTQYTERYLNKVS